jgi:hypothetical protein
MRKMNTNIFLGIAGILVSICVGFGTFYLADKRAKRSRWENAKETVLRDLSKSLGEGNVPDASVIKATIRSVLRTHNATDLSVITLDEISDDLLRQITADPFLDIERRKKLQIDVLKLKEAQEKIEAEMSLEQKEAEQEKLESSEKFTWSTLLSLFAGIIASIDSIYSITFSKSLISFIEHVNSKELFNIYGITLLVAFLTLLVSIASIIFSRDSRKK